MRKFCVYRIFVSLFVLYDSCNSFECVCCVACLALLLFLLSLLLIVLVRLSRYEIYKILYLFSILLHCTFVLACL